MNISLTGGLEEFVGPSAKTTRTPEADRVTGYVLSVDADKRAARRALSHTAICRMLGCTEKVSTTARLEARLPADIHALLKRAAEIEGRTLTDFVVAAAREAACRTIEDAEIVRLSVEDQRQIAEAILNPPKPAPALRRAFKRRRELFGRA